MIDIQENFRKELWNEIIEMMNACKEVKEGSLVHDQCKLAGGEVILENSPVGESQSNGFIENAIKEVQNQIRKLKDQLQAKTTTDILDDSPTWPWLVQYAAQQIHT